MAQVMQGVLNYLHVLAINLKGELGRLPSQPVYRTSSPHIFMSCSLKVLTLLVIYQLHCIYLLGF